MERSLTSMESETQIAWAAGLFEGEGFITRRPVGRRIYPQVGIEMRDRDVLERFVEIMRSHGVIPKERPHGPRGKANIRIRKRSEKNPNHSNICVWTTTGHTAERAFTLMRPFLGQRRKTKGDAILREAQKLLQELLKPRICTECGVRFTPRNHGHTAMYCSLACRGRAYRAKPGYREAANERSRRYKARQRAKRAIPGTSPHHAIR